MFRAKYGYSLLLILLLAASLWLLFRGEGEDTLPATIALSEERVLRPPKW